MAGGPSRIHGFALNVSNYDPAVDPAKTPRDRTTAASDETEYAADLDQVVRRGRHHRQEVRDRHRTRRAGLHPVGRIELVQRQGGRPRRAPTRRPAPLIDAYLYIKTPGESDGTSDPNEPRFDETCGGDDATPGAPQAGKMFDSYLIDLLRNATPPL